MANTESYTTDGPVLGASQWMRGLKRCGLPRQRPCTCAGVLKFIIRFMKAKRGQQNNQHRQLNSSLLFCRSDSST
jgi:hypothetical protein